MGRRVTTGRSRGQGGKEARAWLSEAEYARLVTEAEAQRCTASEFVRRLILTHPTFLSPPPLPHRTDVW